MRATSCSARARARSRASSATASACPTSSSDPGLGLGPAAGGVLVGLGEEAGPLLFARHPHLVEEAIGLLLGVSAVWPAWVGASAMRRSDSAWAWANSRRTWASAPERSRASSSSASARSRAVSASASRRAWATTSAAASRPPSWMERARALASACARMRLFWARSRVRRASASSWSRTSLALGPGLVPGLLQDAGGFGLRVLGDPFRLHRRLVEEPGRLAPHAGERLPGLLVGLLPVGGRLFLGRLQGGLFEAGGLAAGAFDQLAGLGHGLGQGARRSDASRLEELRRFRLGRDPGVLDHPLAGGVGLGRRAVDQVLGLGDGGRDQGGGVLLGLGGGGGDDGGGGALGSLDQPGRLLGRLDAGIGEEALAVGGHPLEGLGVGPGPLRLGVGPDSGRPLLEGGPRLLEDEGGVGLGVGPETLGLGRGRLQQPLGLGLGVGDGLGPLDLGVGLQGRGPRFEPGPRLLEDVVGVGLGPGPDAVGLGLGGGGELGRGGHGVGPEGGRLPLRLAPAAGGFLVLGRPGRGEDPRRFAFRVMADALGGGAGLLDQPEGLDPRRRLPGRGGRRCRRRSGSGRLASGAGGVGVGRGGRPASSSPRRPRPPSPCHAPDDMQGCYPRRPTGPGRRLWRVSSARRPRRRAEVLPKQTARAIPRRSAITTRRTGRAVQKSPDGIRHT